MQNTQIRHNNHHLQTTIPNFLLVGATKAATTWLYECLQEHPEIYVPDLKEVNYFSRRYEQGIDWYLSFFDNVQSETAIGELSPSYFTSEAAPSRIYELNPNVRLIVMLRHPIQRAYSQYCMELRYNTVSDNIEQEFNLDSNIVRESLYYQQIGKFRRLFPATNFKFIIFDDIKKNPQGVLQDLYHFLGVEPNFVNQAIAKPSYAKQPRQKFQQLYTILVAIYRWLNNNSKIGRKILNLIKEQGLNEKFHRLNATKKQYPQLSTSKKQELADFYRSDIQQLSQLLDRDLSHWLSIDP